LTSRITLNNTSYIQLNMVLVKDLKKKHIFTIILLILLTFPLAISNAQSGEELIYLYTSTIVIKYRGNNETILTEDYRAFSLPMNTSWQTAYLQGSSSTYNIVNDSDGNLYMVLDAPSLSTDENVTLSTSFRIVTRQRNHLTLIFLLQGILLISLWNYRNTLLEVTYGYR